MRILKISKQNFKLEKEINEYNKEIEANEEFIHLKEEEELFLTKIEALESLILEKKREALSVRRRTGTYYSNYGEKVRRC